MCGHITPTLESITLNSGHLRKRFTSQSTTQCNIPTPNRNGTKYSNLIMFSDVGTTLSSWEQLYDNTKNEIEAQNKAFKYSFLNCCQNLSMSRLIYLLVEIFVPAQSAK